MLRIVAMSNPKTKYTINSLNINFGKLASLLSLKAFRLIATFPLVGGMNSVAYSYKLAPIPCVKGPLTKFLPNCRFVAIASLLFFLD